MRQMAYDECHSERFLEDYSAHLYLKYEEYLLCHNFCAVFMTAIVSRSDYSIYKRFSRDLSAIIENFSHPHIQGYFRMKNSLQQKQAIPHARGTVLAAHSRNS
jgi:hypothetical protein